MSEDQENQLLRKALALYAGEHVVAKVLAQGEQFLVPSAETVELTLLYYDIAFVTRVDGGLTPKALLDWQRAYAEATTNAIAQSQGRFETFLGDAGSAWWLAREEPLHADVALSCARAMMEAIGELNRRGSRARWPAIQLRVGIHTGEASLGNYGSTTRLRYCAMGDEVNLAAYLGGAGHKRPIVLSQATYDRLSTKPQVELLGKMPVKSGGVLEIYGIE